MDSPPKPKDAVYVAPRHELALTKLRNYYRAEMMGDTLPKGARAAPLIVIGEFLAAHDEAPQAQAAKVADAIDELVKCRIKELTFTHESGMSQGWDRASAEAKDLLTNTLEEQP